MCVIDKLEIYSVLSVILIWMDTRLCSIWFVYYHLIYHAGDTRWQHIVCVLSLNLPCWGYQMAAYGLCTIT